MAQGLDVIVGDARGRPVRIAGLSSWLRRVAPGDARGRVSIALVSDDRIRALNRTYRRRDYATDVLSFPADGAPSTQRTPRTQRSKPACSAATVRTQRSKGDRSAGTPRTQKSEPDCSSVSFVSSVLNDLGEIVIARGVAKRQAHEASHSELTELRVLALHGLLHLLGYDHEKDRGRMRRMERRLRRKGGLSEGLIERSGTPARAPRAAAARGRRARQPRPSRAR